MRSRGRVLFALVFVGACGGERVRAPTVVRPVAPIAARPIPASSPRPGAALPVTMSDGRLVAATARTLPQRFAVDGALDEWATIATIATTATTAASRVVVGIGSNRVGIAAELRADARDGIWLKVRFPVFELSALAEDPYADAPGKTPRCEREHPKDVAAMRICRDEIEARQKRFHAELFARFVHVYRLDASGVQLLAGGRLEPIAGASVAKRAGGNALSVEVELPLAALPRTAEAPIANVSVAAAVGADPAAIANAAEVESTLTPPVAFEPNADVRAVVFDGSQLWASPRFHYQPGDTESLGVSGYPPLDKFSGIEDETRYAETTERLFVPLRRFSDFEIVKMYPDKLGTMRDGKLVSSRQGSRNLRGFVERDGALHAFFLERGLWAIEDRVNGAYEMPGAKWLVLAVRRDGTVERLDLDGPEGPFKRFLRETHAPDFSTFSVEGEADPRGKPAPQRGAIERWVWSWDAKEKTYRASFTTTKVGGKPKAAPGR